MLVFKKTPKCTSFLSMCTSLLTLCVCGDSFNLQHTSSCLKGGLVITRHNELRNLTAEILHKVSKHVVIELLLTPLTGEKLPKSSNTSNQARADVSARGLWNNGQTAFWEVKFFNPLSRCYLHHSLPAAHEKNENKKKREYNQRILQVEHRSSTPLVFSCFGEWAGNAAVSFRVLLQVLLTEEKNIKVRSAHW